MENKPDKAVIAVSGDHPTAWRLRPKDKADLRALSRANIVSADTPTQEDYRDDARAALQAMLEPSEGMVEAGDDTEVDGVSLLSPGESLHVWQSMIRAALEEK